jgi:hypothetical protein
MLVLQNSAGPFFLICSSTRPQPKTATVARPPLPHAAAALHPYPASSPLDQELAQLQQIRGLQRQLQTCNPTVQIFAGIRLPDLAGGRRCWIAGCR